MRQQSEVKVLHHSDGDYVPKRDYDKLKKDLDLESKTCFAFAGEVSEKDLIIENIQTLLGECMTAFATLRDEFHPPSDAYKLAEAFLQKIKAARGSIS